HLGHHRVAECCEKLHEQRPCVVVILGDQDADLGSFNHLARICISTERSASLIADALVRRLALRDWFKRQRRAPAALTCELVYGTRNPPLLPQSRVAPTRKQRRFATAANATKSLQCSPLSCSLGTHCRLP